LLKAVPSIKIIKSENPRLSSRGLLAICKIIADSWQIPGQAREDGNYLFDLFFFQMIFRAPVRE
jgi:hypothetical protein